MKSIQFITIRDTNGRASSLAYGGNHRNQPLATLTVLGNLEHGAAIRPNSNADRLALIAWLQLPEVVEACKN